MNHSGYLLITSPAAASIIIFGKEHRFSNSPKFSPNTGTITYLAGYIFTCEKKKRMLCHPNHGAITATPRHISAPATDSHLPDVKFMEMIEWGCD